MAACALPGDPKVGQAVSHYQIVEQLGQGGMGVVYKARDLRLDRYVALKFLPAQHAESPDAVARLLQEARAISALNHPNIATIYEVGEDQGNLFLVFEYLSGGTLRARVRAEKKAGRMLPLLEVLRCALQIGRGLAHAHGQGLVHRDVKTANAMLTESGAVKILDFGLARARNSRDPTELGRAVGTVAYMSPEQAQGEEMDHRSDIFSFGVVLYEVSTGVLPFSGGSNRTVLDQIIHSPAPSLARFREDLPADLERIVHKALAKRPEQRYQRIEDMLADLESLARDLESGTARGGDSTRTVTQPVSVPGSSRRRRLLTPAVALVAMALVLGAPQRLVHGSWFRRVPAEKHLAVLPFQNLGGDPSSQALCDSLMETLPSMLTGLKGFQESLRLVPASEVRRERIASARDARRMFGVNLALTGSVQRTQGRVRLTINLVDAVSLRQLRAETMEQSLGELSGVEQGVARCATEMLEAAIHPASSTARKPSP